ncbi:hypothetical protein MTR67_051383 [Solanum verrucosum]|uniref:Late blight resistance protein n=1 Tax=Solanum verrucosum TaxID=315347 RepID=A0AAF0V366_SOLVR|nr:hypothetical protein MTR67_051383 [Solanum verrucosum]
MGARDISSRAELGCQAPSLHPGRDRHPETIAGPRQTLGLAFLTQRKLNSKEADPGYLYLHRHKTQANWHQYMECTSMRAGKLNHNLSLKRVQENTYLGSIQLMNN